MKYLLDTNVCIKYLNGDSDNIRKELENRKPDNIALCSVVKSELIYGVLKSSNKEKNLSRLNTFFAPFISLSFDDNCAVVYSEIRSTLEKSGNIIGPYDMQIAAIALYHNMILVTHNTKEFSRITNILLEDWE